MNEWIIYDSKRILFSGTEYTLKEIFKTIKGGESDLIIVGECFLAEIKDSYKS